MSKTIPPEFINTQLCEAMRLSYWQLMEQPAKHVELFTLYLQIKAKVQGEDHKKLERQSSRMKSKARR